MHKGCKVVILTDPCSTLYLLLQRHCLLLLLYCELCGTGNPFSSLSLVLLSYCNSYLPKVLSTLTPTQFSHGISCFCRASCILVKIPSAVDWEDIHISRNFVCTIHIQHEISSQLKGSSLPHLYL